MEPFDSIEKLITEHGSAAVLKVWNDKLRFEASQMQSRFLDLQLKVRDLEHKLEAANEQIRTLNKLNEEDIQFHDSGIEFRRGKRTNGKWMPFCPKCKLPASTPMFGTFIQCSAKCGWQSTLAHNELDAAIEGLPPPLT